MYDMVGFKLFCEMQIHTTVEFYADLHLMPGCKCNNLISFMRICIEVLDPHMISGWILLIRISYMRICIDVFIYTDPHRDAVMVKVLGMAVYADPHKKGFFTYPHIYGFDLHADMH